MNAIEAINIEHDLKHFTGGGDFYKHPFDRIIYSEGVKFLIEQANAHWLLDAIGSYFHSRVMRDAMAADPRLGELQFWTLTRLDDGSAVLTATADRKHPPFITQNIEYTDFPLQEARIWAGRASLEEESPWILHLPSEY